MTHIPCNTMRHRGDNIKARHAPPTWYCVEQAWLETELPSANWVDDVDELAERNAYEAMINAII